jgi:multidrug efflux pump subunit AcrA (membrane-fusion protein)
VKVRISFDHLDPRILPDMGVKVAFLDNSQPAADAKKNGDDAKAAPQVLISQDAVVKDGSGHPIVFVVHDAKVERRAVSLGGSHGSDVEVFAGIADGDSVVVKPPPGLRDGEEVEIKR